MCQVKQIGLVIRYCSEVDACQRIQNYKIFLLLFLFYKIKVRLTYVAVVSTDGWLPQTE